MSSALWLVLSAVAMAAPATPAPAKTVDPDEAKARVLFKEAQVAYDVGRFDDALTRYSDAYTLKPLPGFLFNIAQCHRNLGHFKEAAFFFGRFIDNARPDTADLPLARELLDEMNRKQSEKEQLEKDAAAAAAAERREKELKTPGDAPQAVNLQPGLDALPPPPVPAAEPEKPVYTKWWFWTVVGVVVAGAATATVVAVTEGNQKPVDMRPKPTLGEINGTGQL